MRDFKGMKRQRGRNRSGGGGGGGGQGGGGGGGGKSPHNVNRAFDSNGPDNVKIRGHAQHVFEKYQQLARDAHSGGDRVLAENYLQHAEHYFRVLRTIQPNRAVSEIMGRDAVASGFDIDFEDENENGGEESEGSAAEGGEASQGEDRGDRQEVREGRQEYREPRQDRDYRPESRQDRDQRPENRDQRPENRDRGPREGGYQDRPRRDDQPREPRRDDQPREPRRDDQPRRDRSESRREERPGYGERRPEGRSEEAAAIEAPAVVDTPGSVLRSQDGGVSHAPAFLQAATPAPPAEEAAPKPRAPRTRTRKPRADEGAAAAAETPEEV
ncbi:MAG: hypothetical protein B7Y99_10330 [Caulobacterales bacterium 32-69-10]|nr:MAG: hypothetical protein B7Y99_10330 [Caulobacterales bacterium 32-69-10]